jgi:hypothetical protein
MFHGRNQADSDELFYWQLTQIGGLKKCVRNGQNLRLEPV